MKFRQSTYPSQRKAMALGLLACAVSVGTVACGKKSDESKTDPVVVVTPETPEEKTAVVVDDQGAVSAVSAVVLENKTPAATKGCSSKGCFELGDWRLNFGQTYVQRQTTSGVETVQIDGFENSKLSSLQFCCLNETAEKLKEFAVSNPEAMKPFAEAKIATTFAARVYDTTNVKNKVAPSLYFIKGSDGTKGGESLARGKWVIRSAITGEGGKDDCQILSDDQIEAQLNFFKGQLIK